MPRLPQITDRESLPEPHQGVIPFYAKVDEVDGRILTTRSRAIGLLGLAPGVGEARTRVGAALKAISGPFHARSDIGLEAEAASSVPNA